MTEDEMEMAEAQAEYDAATPEERALFVATHREVKSRDPRPITVAEQFGKWRGSRWHHEFTERYLSANADERRAIEEEHPEHAIWLRRRAIKQDRKLYLKSLGFPTGEDAVTGHDGYYLASVDDHLWEQISSLIAGGHVKPAPAPPSGVDAAQAQ